jgi:Rieske Fe-S protein
MPAQGKDSALLTESQIRNGDTAIMCWPVSAQTHQPRMETPYNRLWVVRTQAGFRGYSVICQHAGCLVSDWDSKTHRLTCPCHGSVYDVEHDGAVVGGPAPLPLPFAAIAVVDGHLRLAGGFSAKVGGHASRAD